MQRVECRQMVQRPHTGCKRRHGGNKKPQRPPCRGQWAGKGRRGLTEATQGPNRGHTKATVQRVEGVGQERRRRGHTEATQGLQQAPRRPHRCLRAEGRGQEKGAEATQRPSKGHRAEGRQTVQWAVGRKRAQRPRRGHARAKQMPLCRGQWAVKGRRVHTEATQRPPCRGQGKGAVAVQGPYRSHTDATVQRAGKGCRGCICHTEVSAQRPH